MDRKKFIKKVCTYGVCGCAAITAIPALAASSTPASAGEDEPDWRIEFMQKRMAKHIEHLNSKIDEDTMNELIEMLGRSCSSDGMERYSDYVGNVKGFLKDVLTQWGDTADYDEANGIIKVTGVKRDSCFCPFVDKKLMSVDFCNCSLGWQKNTYETIIGKKVDVTIDESILRGAERCSFTIKII